ncbi:MAG: NAD-dependent epimerase/dehydratase family protein [Candidatus Bathyarchaeia archaeon]|jgi:nucleoside-diphosphate-sugar epimerase
MKILVTGGAGFIGSTLVPELLKQGHQVTVLDNLTWGMHGLLADWGQPGFEFVEGDVRDEELIERLLTGKDVVVHLAALVGCGLCEGNKEEAADVNVNGSKTIDHYLTDNQLLIYASTGSIYGLTNEVASCTEKTAPNPKTQYAVTKYEAEKVFCKRPNVVTLRFATAFGVSYRMRFDLLVNQLVYEAVKKRVLLVYEKNANRSVVHVRDIAQSILFAIANRESMQGQIFNVGSDLALTKEEIAWQIQQHVGCPLQFAGSPVKDGKDYQLSCQKIMALGYHTSVTLEQGITELISTVNKADIDGSCFNDKSAYNHLQWGVHG